MVNKPIKINDYNSPVESTRQELMKESTNPSHKGFSFKGFVTEKERIVFNLLKLLLQYYHS